MQTVEELPVSFAKLPEPMPDTRVRFLDRIERRTVLILIVIVAAAFSVRAYRLGAAGLAEDETHKIFAVRAYLRGDFTNNAEHPMLMKMLCLASLQGRALWNRIAAAGFGVSEEAAIRLPNAFFGALTVIPLFLLARSLFGFRTGLITSLMWAIGLNAMWFNRVAKEDTLLVFFMILGFYLYNHAKSRPEHDKRTQERSYALAGAAFGLMLSSKYFPHYLALFHLYYYLAAYDGRNNRPLTKRMWARHYGALLLTLFIFNFAIFSPQTWRYLWGYVNEDFQTHHGYLVMGRLYPNEISDTPGGSPWLFYWLYLAVKLPAPLIAAFVIGAVDVFRRRDAGADTRGYLFLRVMLFSWLAPMCIVGSKFLRYTLGLIPFVYMAAAVGTILTYSYLRRSIRNADSGDRKRTWAWNRAAGAIAASGAALIFVAAPAGASLYHQENPGLFTNWIGGGRAGWFFPHDEFYDIGARESIKYLADNAQPGARIASDIPGVVQYYLDKYNRKDIVPLAMSSLPLDGGNARFDFAIIQTGRIYFENRETIERIKKTCPAVQSSSFEGVVTSAVYSSRGPGLE